jgi:broad specificity phosphatase PhoE
MTLNYGGTHAFNPCLDGSINRSGTSGSRRRSSSRCSTSTRAQSQEPDASRVPSGPKLPPLEPTTKRLFLVRHGEVINPGGDGRAVYYGAMDVPLSELGKQEALAAANYLAQFEIEYVVSSPLSRAVDGAQEVWSRQAHHHRDEGNREGVLTLPGFSELDRGEWCGKTLEEIGVDHMARFDAGDESVTPRGGESYHTVQKRVRQAQQEVLDRLTPGRAAVIVSHLQVTRCMLSDALNIPIEGMAKLPVATASITCIDYPLDTSLVPTVHFQSFKPDMGLKTSKDGAN